MVWLCSLSFMTSAFKSTVWGRVDTMQLGLPLEEPGLPLGRCPPFFHPQALSGLVGEAYLPLCPRCLFSLDHSKFHLAQLRLGKIFSHSF